MLLANPLPRLLPLAVFASLFCLDAFAQQPDTKDRPAVAIGTYDSRAIAIAYGRSELAQRSITELREKYEKAKADGDQKLAAKLERQGEARQIRLHLQAFSNAPVDDALDAVREQIPAFATRMHVAAIVSAADYHDASVELVDVTDELVKLFNPTPQTLRTIEECRKQKPAPIEQIAKIPAKN